MKINSVVNVNKNILREESKDRWASSIIRSPIQFEKSLIRQPSILENKMIHKIINTIK